jgi:ketosteroid isomerase-like protein
VSRDNIEIVRQVFEAVGRHDRAAVFSLYDADVELDLTRVPVGGLTGQAIYRGHDGLRKMFRDWYEAFEYQEQYDELIGRGDQVVSVSTGRGRGRASGTDVEASFYLVWTLRHGQVVRIVWYLTRDEALAAAGLSENPEAIEAEDG